MKFRLRTTALVLLALFGVFAFLHHRYLQGRFEVNADLVGELATADFLDDPTPPSADWPTFRNSRHDGHALPFALGKGFVESWKTPVGEGWAAPVVADDRVYLFSRESDAEVLRCVALSDAAEHWRKSTPVTAAFEYTSGPRSSPCVSDGRIFTVGITGLVQCRNVADGALLWEKDLAKAYGAVPPKWGVAFSPLVEAGLLILNPGGKDASVVACKADTGDEVWRRGSDPAGYGSPQTATLAGQRVVVVFNSTALTGWRLGDGKEIFRHPWPADFDVSAPMPVIFRTRQAERVREYAFVTTGYRRGFALLHLRPREDGTIVPETVYTGDDFCSHYGSPVRIGDHLVGFDETKLTALDLRTGKVRWKQSGYKKGSLCALGTDLIVVGEEGQLALGPVTPDRPFDPLWSIPGNRFSPTNYRNMPVVAQGRLLVCGGGVVVCFDLRVK